MHTQAIATVGLSLLILGWVPETLSNWKNRGKNLDLRFAVLYFFGSLLLAWHALNISDLVFFALNFCAGLIAAFNAWIILSNRSAYVSPSEKTSVKKSKIRKQPLKK